MKQIGCATIVVRGDDVLLQYNIKKGGNEFPGGKHQRDESMQECASRELQEETGIIVHPTDMHFVGYVDEEPGWLAMMFLTFVPEGTTPRVREPDKHQGYYWLAADRLHEIQQPTKAVSLVVDLYADVILDMVRRWPRLLDEAT